jgi:phasin family protein
MAARKPGDGPQPEIPAEVITEPAATALPAPAAAARDGSVPSRTPEAVASAAEARFDKAREEVKTNMDKAMKTAEELVSFGQGNLEALVKSSQIWAAGVQDLSKQVAASAQAQVDQTMATLKALAGAKSLKEAIELQSSLARASVEKAVAETGKLTDASFKLAEQALAPLTARISLAAERFGRAV